MVPKHCTPKHLTPIEVCRLSVKAYEELPEQFWIIDQRPITGGNLEELVISGTVVFIDSPDVTFFNRRKV